MPLGLEERAAEEAEQPRSGEQEAARRAMDEEARALQFTEEKMARRAAREEER